MEDNTLVHSSFLATINAPIEKGVSLLGALRYRSRNSNLAPQIAASPVQPWCLTVGACRSMSKYSAEA